MTTKHIEELQTIFDKQIDENNGCILHIFHDEGKWAYEYDFYGKSLGAVDSDFDTAEECVAFIMSMHIVDSKVDRSMRSAMECFDHEKVEIDKPDLTLEIINVNLH